MNKQQVLDIDNPNYKEWAVQQLISRTSKTDMEAIRRVFKKVYEMLYKTQARELTYAEVYSCIDIAVKLLNDEKLTEEQQDALA